MRGRGPMAQGCWSVLSALLLQTVLTGRGPDGGLRVAPGHGSLSRGNRAYRQPQLRRLRCAAPVGSTGAAVLYRHTQQDTSINSRHEVDRLGAAGSASNESRSIDHLQVMNSLVGAQWRRRTHGCSRTGRGPCASRPPTSRPHAGGSWPCGRDE